MTAVPSEVRASDAAPAQRTGVGRTPGLSFGAKTYLTAVGIATAAAAGPPIARLGVHTHGWPTFLILASCAAIAQLFVVRTTRDHSYHTAIVFLIAAALLLPPEMVALMGVVQHIPEWLKHRYTWYIQTFNICNYTLNALAASWAARHLLEVHAGFVGYHGRWALAGLVACVVFVVMNDALLAGMLYLARGHRLRETKLFSPGNVSMELVLAVVGIGVAAFWRSNPWLVPFAIAPLLLIHRSLHVPRLEEQARIDPKTGLFNARHFGAVLNEELARAQRFGRPLSLIMADLDLLREINNTYGHLAGDGVLAGIAKVFQSQLRHYDVPARFGGEEFAILLPETPSDQALEIAERIRRAVADQQFEVETSSEPISVTISMGVASSPDDGTDPNELVHHADLAVYRAKLQGRNRVLPASEDPLLVRGARLMPAPPSQQPGEPLPPPRRLPEPVSAIPSIPDRPQAARHAADAPRLVSLSPRLLALVAGVTVVGIGLGVLGAILGRSLNMFGLLVVTGLVAVGQALALEFDEGSISVGAVGALTGAALFGPKAALAIALAQALVDWSARRSPVHMVLFNVGTLTLASLAAAGLFAFGLSRYGDPFTIVMALVAGAAYYVANTGLVSIAVAIEGRQRWVDVWRERFLWLLPHYLGYGFIGGVIAITYDAAGLYALAVAIVPLLLMRKTQAAYLRHTQRSAQKLRVAAETIQHQNVSLERANRLLRERSTAAMESLSATVDARDSYTAGHSRRVQRLSLAIGRELGLSQPELDLLGHAALFHDIGKLAVPDAILLKPDGLDDAEWGPMRAHADEGARIIDRLGFLADAVPAIRHHHERFDGSGYPDGLRGEEIPLGARIIHVADALDSMLTSRIYRDALSPALALAELERGVGTQFCPRCVAALERILPEDVVRRRTDHLGLLAAS
jgi:diguanylate cyclase (GGDEF)-like protein/putative nucleotidyltransferase with HDIG domain